MSSPIPLLPSAVFAHVLAFERSGFHLFQAASKKTHETAISLLNFYRTEILNKARQDNTPFYQRILSFSPDLTVQKFHELVYVNALMFGGKWGIKCYKFASNREVDLMNQEIKERRNEQLRRLWKVLYPMIQLTQGLEIPLENMESWMKCHRNRCFGISLQSLPLTEKKLTLLKEQLQIFQDLHKKGRLKYSPASLISASTHVEGQMELRSRLAEDLDRRLMDQKIYFVGQSVKIINTALDKFMASFKKCECKGPVHDPISIHVHCTRESNSHMRCETAVFHDKNIDASSDALITLHFYALEDLSASYYFYESGLKRELARQLEPQLISMNLPDQEKAMAACVNSAITHLRRIHFSQANKEKAPDYFATTFRVERNQNGLLHLHVEMEGSLVKTEPILMPVVTLRFYFSDINNFRSEQSGACSAPQ